MARWSHDLDLARQEGRRLPGRRETQEAMSAWQEAGFRMMPGVFSSAEVTALQSALADSAIAAEALGDEALPFRATLFDKSRRANWLVVWHQDTALPLRRRKEVRGWGPWSIKAGILYAHAPA